MLLENMDTDDLTALEEQVMSAMRQTQVVCASKLEGRLDAFCRELELREIPYQRGVWQAEEVSGIPLNVGYVIDVLVDGRIVVQATNSPWVSREDEMRLLSLLSLGKRRLGFLVNFYASQADGVVRKISYESQLQLA